MNNYAYTVSEIDRLRNAAREWHHSLDPETLEIHLRALMLRGVRPEEFEAEVAHLRIIKQRVRALNERGRSK
jgi:hypothetical protein